MRIEDAVNALNQYISEVRKRETSMLIAFWW